MRRFPTTTAPQHPQTPLRSHPGGQDRRAPIPQHPPEAVPKGEPNKAAGTRSSPPTPQTPLNQGSRPTWQKQRRSALPGGPRGTAGSSRAARPSARSSPAPAAISRRRRRGRRGLKKPRPCPAPPSGAVPVLGCRLVLHQMSQFEEGKEEIVDVKGVGVLVQVVRRSCGVPGGAQDQAGWGWGCAHVPERSQNH